MTWPKVDMSEVKPVGDPTSDNADTLSNSRLANGIFPSVRDKSMLDVRIAISAATESVSALCNCTVGISRPNAVG